MNQKQAIAKLRKIIGGKLGYRTNNGALNAEQREAQAALSRSLREKERELKEALDARRAELLKDPVYVDLRTRWNAQKDAADAALSKSHRKPIEVGRYGELFFTVLASGDNWDEVVTQLSEGGRSE